MTTEPDPLNTKLKIEDVIRNASNRRWTLVLEGNRREDIPSTTAALFEPLKGTSITIREIERLRKEGEDETWREPRE